MPCWVLVLVLAVFTGCGGASRVVRLETGEGVPIVFRPRDKAVPVELADEAFEEALGELARDVRPSPRPLESARRLFGVPSRTGSYRYEDEGRRLVPGGEHPLASELPEAEVELARAYGRWCARKAKPGDCLRLLEGGPALDGDGKYTLAMALALDSVWDETAGALKDLADPMAVQARGRRQPVAPSSNAGAP